MQYIEWVGDNIGLVQAAIAIVLTVITAVYVILTWRLLKEAQRQREQGTSPNVVAFLRTHEAHISLVYLRIENIGSGAAHTIRVRFEGISGFPGDVSLETHGVVTKGISVMPPGTKIDIFLLSAIEHWKALKDLEVVVELECKSDSGNKHKNSFPLVFSQLEGHEHVGKPPLYDMAENIKKIAASLKSWPGVTGRLDVNTHSADEVDAERSRDSIWVRIRHLSPESRQLVEGQVNSLLSAETDQHGDSDA